ncbi:MAG: prepilin-type N-terminal cleavage/methylation domain-containing protein [Candidatus Sumerlaeia bacterium]|nr:prepilin-type N-terminal cleavage/methylation domain-containing protein [Candidatus Sumerlaeia bacterium]
MKYRAFTLLELLFVVATIAILAAIAVPNFLEAQVRSKVSRSLNDMAVIDGALRAYEADYRVYPPNHLETRMWIHAASQVESGGMVRSQAAMVEADESVRQLYRDGLVRVDRANRILNGGSFSRWSYRDANPVVISGYDLHRLTTPIAYFTESLAMDTFADSRGLPLGYLNFQSLGRSQRSQNGKFNVYVYEQGETSTRNVAADPFGDMGMWGDMEDFMMMGGFGMGVPEPMSDGDYYMVDPEERDPIMRSYPETTTTTRTVQLISDRYLLYSFGPSVNQSRVYQENLLWDDIVPYDPTNGTVSKGLIYTTGHGIRRHGALGGHIR